jgi:hypothetical protein
MTCLLCTLARLLGASSQDKLETHLLAGPVGWEDPVVGLGCCRFLPKMRVEWLGWC